MHLSDAEPADGQQGGRGSFGMSTATWTVLGPCTVLPVRVLALCSNQDRFLVLTEFKWDLYHGHGVWKSAEGLIAWLPWVCLCFCNRPADKSVTRRRSR